MLTRAHVCRRVPTCAEAGSMWQVWIDLSCGRFSVLGHILVTSSAFFVLMVCLFLERFRKKALSIRIPKQVLSPRFSNGGREAVCP